MSKRRFLENFQIATQYLDIENWPMVNKMQLSIEDREVFEKRETAIILYMTSKKTLNEIKEITTIDAKELREFLTRCLTFDNVTNCIWGFRALIPHKRISEQPWNGQSSPAMSADLV